MEENLASTETDGGAWAVLLAASIGCAAFGLLSAGAESFHGLSAVLNIYEPAGNLSGVGVAAILIWLVVWAALHCRWKNSSVSSPCVLQTIIFVLVAASLVATCPLFF